VNMVNQTQPKPKRKPTGAAALGPGPGRPKGSQNKTTVAAKEAIQLAAEALGGPERLTAWAQEDPKNEAIFWGTIYPKLLPLQLNGSGPNGEHIFSRIVREVIDGPQEQPVEQRTTH
jgi:hypothetical protein